jgi:nucleoside permease NupC
MSVLDQHSITMASYALWGFANFSSIAIQIGGIGRSRPRVEAISPDSA